MNAPSMPDLGRHAMTRDTLGPAGQLTWDFLTLFAQKRYGDANAFLAPGCRMLFPGGVVLTDCLQMTQRASSLYRWVVKDFEQIDEMPSSTGTVVYNYGMLRGEWLDGSALANIRYIDRFVVRDGKITDQKVWNDLGMALLARKA